MGLNMNEKTLRVIVHKIISYIRKEMKDVWEATIKKTHNWMIDETLESLEENHFLFMWFIDEIGRLFGIEHDCKKAGLTADQVLVERLQRSKPIMDRIKEKFERFARSNYKGLGALTKKALKYIKTEWSAMQTILQDDNLELSNNLAEQMMRHIKLNLKNCLNIGSEDSALDYAFMFSVIESCYMNKLSPGCYIKELVSRLTAKPVCTAEKVALLPCFMQK